MCLVVGAFGGRAWPPPSGRAWACPPNALGRGQPVGVHLGCLRVGLRSTHAHRMSRQRVPLCQRFRYPSISPSRAHWASVRRKPWAT